MSDEEFLNKKSELLVKMANIRGEIMMTYKERDVAQMLHDSQLAIITAAQKAATAYLSQRQFLDDVMSSLHSRQHSLQKELEELEKKYAN